MVGDGGVAWVQDSDRDSLFLLKSAIGRRRWKGWEGGGRRQEGKGGKEEKGGLRGRMMGRTSLLLVESHSLPVLRDDRNHQQQHKKNNERTTRSALLFSF